MQRDNSASDTGKGDTPIAGKLVLSLDLILTSRHQIKEERCPVCVISDGVFSTLSLLMMDSHALVVHVNFDGATVFFLRLCFKH